MTASVAVTPPHSGDHEYVPINPGYDRENRIYRVLHHGPLLDVFVLDMRWYRDADSPDKQAFNDGGILGAEQAVWLKRELKRSKARWKVISNDMPLCEVVADAGGKFEAISQGDNGKPLGRELQIADLLTFLKRNRIHNVVWLTTDVHYTAAHLFDPDKAAYQDFDPFWQFTSGPLDAGGAPVTAVGEPSPRTGKSGPPQRNCWAERHAPWRTTVVGTTVRRAGSSVPRSMRSRSMRAARRPTSWAS
jgi:phosphodiesterase/alkaline phosphatase D-like protein